MTVVEGMSHKNCMGLSSFRCERVTIYKSTSALGPKDARV